MRTLRLPRFGRTAAVTAAVVALASGGGVAYGAVTSCPTQNNPSNAQLEQYMKCRLDAIETKIDTLAKPPVTTTVTATPSTVTTTATVTVTAQPTTATNTTTSPNVTTTTSAPATSTTTAASSACPVAGTNKAGAADPFGGCFPGPGNVGVPPGTQLTAYSGPIAIDSSNDLTVFNPNVTIDSKTIGTKGNPVHIRVAASGFTLKNSVLYGIVTEVDGYPASYTVQDSVIDSTGDTAFKSATGSDVMLLRNEILGSFSGGVCDHCTVKDNWFHGEWIPQGSSSHMSAYRMDDHTVVTHNTLSCDFVPPLGLNDPAGCSADLTGYGDWGPVQYNTISRNLFQANPAAQYFCAYGGSSGANGSKPYGAQANNVVFDSNVFQKGSSGKCGAAGAVTDFDPTRPGNQWTGNLWDDGTTVVP